MGVGEGARCVRASDMAASRRGRSGSVGCSSGLVRAGEAEMAGWRGLGGRIGEVGGGGGGDGGGGGGGGGRSAGRVGGGGGGGG